jgi:SPX domain protein involved in polyphosphate accumulation
MMYKAITRYEPITLEEMSSIRLMNRTDTKFVTSLHLLNQLLDMASDDYRVQEVNGKRVAPYYTMYFDTTSHEMYTRHASGRSSRQKLRIRSYVDSNLNFLEVKTKDNHGRTSKKRISLNDFNPKLPNVHFLEGHQGPDDEVADFVTHLMPYEVDSLYAMLENNFDRITLVNKKKTERLTIDTNLTLKNLETREVVTLPNLAIIELKRDGLQPSPILEMLRQLRIHKMGFSKYCIGMALTNESLRSNRLKERIHNIFKLEQQ